MGDAVPSSHDDRDEVVIHAGVIRDGSHAAASIPKPQETKDSEPDRAVSTEKKTERAEPQRSEPAKRTGAHGQTAADPHRRELEMKAEEVMQAERNLDAKPPFPKAQLAIVISIAALMIAFILYFLVM